MADEDDSHIALSWPIFSLLIGAALSGGAGVGTVLSPQIEQKALEACFDNSQRAIDVAVQHGAELQVLRTILENRTADRYTGRQSTEDWRTQYRVNDEIFHRLDRLEK